VPLVLWDDDPTIAGSLRQVRQRDARHGEVPAATIALLTCVDVDPKAIGEVQSDVHPRRRRRAQRQAENA
jgi:hypothetical protein